MGDHAMHLETAARSWPHWIPGPARAYLAHTELGLSLREVARKSGCHASTVLRQVRRIEARRDDPLVDHALRRMGAGLSAPGANVDADGAHRRGQRMTTQLERKQDRDAAPKGDEIDTEAQRILCHLATPGTCLAVADGLERAAVVRECADGQTQRIAITPREVAEAMALRDWIATRGTGRIARYRLTPVGRAALRRLRAGEDDARFGAQHRSLGADPTGGRARYNACESPVTALARRKDRDGSPFLSSQMVDAGERLREDFELSQMGPRVAQNWDRFLTAGIDRGGDTSLEPGSDAARARVQAALAELGPGLADIALRTCCFLEGLETVEKRLGWAARSGKIVLRIALERLHSHYERVHGGRQPLIG